MASACDVPIRRSILDFSKWLRPNSWGFRLLEDVSNLFSTVKQISEVKILFRFFSYIFQVERGRIFRLLHLFLTKRIRGCACLQFSWALRSQLHSQLRNQLRSQLHSPLPSQLLSQLLSQLHSQLRTPLLCSAVVEPP